MSAMNVLSPRRRPAPPPPMAVPLDPEANTPLGVRLAAWAQGAVTRRIGRATRRVLSWACVALCVGVLAVGYLLQTSYVASLADARGQLERDTLAMQDANARLLARAADARALGRAEPAARAQGLRVPEAGNVAYLTAVDVPDPTATPTAVATAMPDTVERVRMALLGRASVLAPTPAPAGTTATAEAAARFAPTGNGTRPAFATPTATPLATVSVPTVPVYVTVAPTVPVATPRVPPPLPAARAARAPAAPVPAASPTRAATPFVASPPRAATPTMGGQR